MRLMHLKATTAQIVAAIQIWADEMDKCIAQPSHGGLSGVPKAMETIAMLNRLLGSDPVMLAAGDVVGGGIGPSGGKSLCAQPLPPFNTDNVSSLEDGPERTNTQTPHRFATLVLAIMKDPQAHGLPSSPTCKDIIISLRARGWAI